MKEFKKRIHKLLFPDIHKILEAGYEARLKAYQTSATLKDVYRERMKSIRPNRHTDNTILYNHLMSLDDNSRLAFLRKGKDIFENETFRKVTDSLIIEQEHKSMIESENMEQVNFNRATINGLILLEDQISELFEMFKTEQDERDRKMTEEEKFTAL